MLQKEHRERFFGLAFEHPPLFPLPFSLLFPKVAVCYVGLHLRLSFADIFSNSAYGFRTNYAFSIYKAIQKQKLNFSYFIVTQIWQYFSE